MIKPITPLGIKWELKNSLWILCLFIPITIPISYIFIGVKCENKKWLKSAASYLIVTHALSIILWNVRFNHHLSGLMIYALILIWINALRDGFQQREYYLMHLYGTMDSDEREKLEVAEIKRKAKKEQEEAKEKAPQIMPSKVIFDKQSEKAHFIAKRAREQKEPTIINVNEASIDEFSSIPGIDGILARKIVMVRRQGNVYASSEDLLEKTKIKRRILSDAEQYFAFSEEEVEQMNLKQEELRKKMNKQQVGREVDF